VIRTRNFIAIVAAVLAAASLEIAASPPQKDTWEEVAVPTTASFRGLSAVSDKIVWASGTEGTVVRTIDGGNTWSARAVSGAEKLDFRGIHAFDANSAVIVSSGNAEEGQARIYRTTDGGQTWKLAYEQKTPGVFFDAIAFWDRRHGIVVSDPVDGRFALFATADGGATWSPIPAANMPPALPNEGAFAASNSCLAVEGESNVWFVTGGASVARVFHSRDRGKSWKVAETPLHPANARTGLFSVAFRDAQNGIAVGGDYAHPTDSQGPVIFLTSDGGATWVAGPATDPPGLFLSSVAYRPPKSGAGAASIIAAGTAGIVSKSPGAGWQKISAKNVNVVAYSTSETGWAAGPKGAVLQSHP